MCNSFALCCQLWRAESSNAKETAVRLLPFSAGLLDAILMSCIAKLFFRTISLLHDAWYMLLTKDWGGGQKNFVKICVSCSGDIHLLTNWG